MLPEESIWVYNLPYCKSSQSLNSISVAYCKDFPISDLPYCKSSQSVNSPSVAYCKDFPVSDLTYCRCCKSVFLKQSKLASWRGIQPRVHPEGRHPMMVPSLKGLNEGTKTTGPDNKIFQTGSTTLGSLSWWGVPRPGVLRPGHMLFEQIWGHAVHSGWDLSSSTCLDWIFYIPNPRSWSWGS